MFNQQQIKYLTAKDESDLLKNLENVKHRFKILEKLTISIYQSFLKLRQHENLVCLYLIHSSNEFNRSRQYFRLSCSTVGFLFAFIDKSVFRAKGGIWHKKDMKIDRVPHPSIDTEG